MLTVKEIAKDMKVSKAKVIGWIETGALDAVNVGEGAYRKFRVSEESLEKFKGIRSAKKVPTKGKRVQVEQIV